MGKFKEEIKTILALLLQKNSLTGRSHESNQLKLRHITWDQQRSPSVLPNIIIGTPTFLINGHRSFPSNKSLNYIISSEVDRLIELGFESHLNTMISSVIGKLSQTSSRNMKHRLTQVFTTSQLTFLHRPSPKSLCHPIVIRIERKGNEIICKQNPKRFMLCSLYEKYLFSSKAVVTQ